MRNRLSINFLYKSTYIYLALPFLMFCVTWLNYTCALGLGLLFLLAFEKVYIGIAPNRKYFISNKIFVAILVSSMIWCFLAGIGYFYYQSWDYHFRNAVFRDLINFEWPVFYPKPDTPLVYYAGFWLVPAALAKLTTFGISDPEIRFVIANIYLFIYAVIGVALIFCHIIINIGHLSLKKVLICLAIFIFFSGIDVVGNIFYSNNYFSNHIEWWASPFQYSSMTTDIFWVFNQFIPSSLVILLVYNEKNIQTFGFIFVLSLFFAPYPALSIGIIMLCYALQQLFICSNKKDFFSNSIFSVPNIISVFWLLPVIILYFITNTGAVQGLYNHTFHEVLSLKFLIFIFLEFLLYALIIFKYYKKDIFFIASVVLLCFIPFFRFDQQNNFCMRASMPALILLALFCIRFLFTQFDAKKNYLLKFLLALLLIFGAQTSIMEFYRGIHAVFLEKKINLVKDEIFTLNQNQVIMPKFGWSSFHQFSAPNYKTDFFWQYLAKKHTY